MDAPPESPPPEKISLPLRRTWLNTDLGGNAYWPTAADYLAEFAENVGEYQRKARRRQRMDFDDARHFRRMLACLVDIEAHSKGLSIADQIAIEDAGRRMRQILSDLATLEGRDAAPLLAEVRQRFSPAWCGLLRLTLSKQDEFGARGTFLDAMEAAHFYTAKVRSGERLTPDEVDRLHDVVKSRFGVRAQLEDSNPFGHREDAYDWRMLDLEFETAYRRIGRVLPILSMRYALRPGRDWASRKDTDMWSWCGPDPLGKPWCDVYWNGFWDELRRRAEAATKESSKPRVKHRNTRKPKPSEQPANEQSNKRYWVWALHPLENDHTPNMTCDERNEPGRIVQSYKNASHGGIAFSLGSWGGDGWLVGPRFYRPTAGELEVLRRVFPDVEPDNPSWPHIEAELIAHGHSRADLQQMQAPTLIRLLAELHTPREASPSNQPVFKNGKLSQPVQYIVDDPLGQRTLIVPAGELVFVGNPAPIVLDIEAQTRTRLCDGGNPLWFIRLHKQFREKRDAADGVNFDEYCQRRHAENVSPWRVDEQLIQRRAREEVSLRLEKLLDARSDFRWPMHPLTDELERYTALDGIITSCQANAGAYTPTLGDRADFARLFPDDDECCPPWERMRAELIAVGFSFPIGAADMKPPDVLAAIQQVRVKASHTAPGPTSTPRGGDDGKSHDEYLPASHYRLKYGIQPNTLRMASKRGAINARMIGKRWHYSDDDVRRTRPDDFVTY